MLRKGDLREAVFRDSSFVRASLYEADFSGATLTGVDFRKADLSKANFAGADVSGARFDGAILTETALVNVARGIQTATGISTVMAIAG